MNDKVLTGLSRERFYALSDMTFILERDGIRCTLFFIVSV